MPCLHMLPVHTPAVHICAGPCTDKEIGGLAHDEMSGLLQWPAEGTRSRMGQVASHIACTGCQQRTRCVLVQARWYKCHTCFLLRDAWSNLGRARAGHSVRRGLLPAVAHAEGGGRIAALRHGCQAMCMILFGPAFRKPSLLHHRLFA